MLAAALWSYLGALGAALICLWTRGRAPALAAVFLCGLGAAFQTAGLTLRSLAAGRWPFASLFEFLLLFALGTAALTVLVAVRHRLPEVAPFTLLLIVGLTAYAAVIARPAEPLVPALQSYWLQFHVVTAVLAYGSFALACALALVYLARGRGPEEGPPVPAATPARSATGAPSARGLEGLTYRLVAFGFALLTLAIVTGAVWAEEVWGAWWSWDPKETWALVTWLVYAFYLHVCAVRGWRGRRAAWLAVLGFALVLFTLLGVTLLLPGLHSY